MRERAEHFHAKVSRELVVPSWVRDRAINKNVRFPLLELKDILDWREDDEETGPYAPALARDHCQLDFGGGHVKEVRLSGQSLRRLMTLAVRVERTLEEFSRLREE